MCELSAELSNDNDDDDDTIMAIKAVSPLFQLSFDNCKQTSSQICQCILFLPLLLPFLWMANWPRWIEDDCVDSKAMLSAYLWYCGSRSDGVLSNDDGATITLLPMIVHNTSGPEPLVPTGVTLLRCTTQGCQRCAQMRGGYKFRWYYQGWYAKYVDMSRPGAWTLRQHWF